MLVLERDIYPVLKVLLMVKSSKILTVLLFWMSYFFQIFFGQTRSRLSLPLLLSVHSTRAPSARDISITPNL